MWTSLFSALAIWSTLACANPVVLNEPRDLESLLQSFSGKHFPNSTFIQPGYDAPIRWSSYDVPMPKYVVNVATEKETAFVVKVLYEYGISWLAQNGGSAWPAFPDDITVIINLRGLNEFSVCENKTLTTIGGGLYINDTLSQAWDAGVEVLTANCPCLGVLGPYMGAGYGNLAGLYGLGIDNLVSFRLVTPQGNLITVTPESEPDLWWAVRGAGPNFGIVTSAVIKSYPVLHSESFAWTGDLAFDQKYLEDVVNVIGSINLQPKMNVFMYFISLGGAPVVLTTPFLYRGTNESFREAFAALYAIPHILDTTGPVDYKDFNDATQSFCDRGARKPTYGAGFNIMVPEVWRNIWNAYVDFQAEPGAEESIVLLEVYSLIKAKSVPADQQGAYPYRALPFNAMALPWYTDPSLDAKALAWGEYARDQWRSQSGLPAGVNATYINFAHGDEPNEVVYGDSLPRLQQIKKRVDPTNVMRFWYNIKT